jgi:hypothetical protein
MADRITYVGLDVHKESIVVAVASGGLRGEAREYGRIANTATALDRLLRKLGGEGMTLRFCYEAGPCGYGIQRRLSTQGHEYVVVAPSLIPKRAGDRVKTDRRDAASLAKAAPGGRVDGSVGSRCPARGDARSGAGAARRGAQSAPGAPAALRIFAAPGLPTMVGRPGPNCIAAGWRDSRSTRRSITSCSKTISRRVKPPWRAAIG